MDIIFTKETYKAIQKAGAKSPIFHEEEVYRNIEIESRLILPKDRKLIRETLSTPDFSQFIENRRVLWSLDHIEKIESGKPIKIKKLTILKEVVEKAISKLPNKFIFLMVKKYDCYLPYFVSSVEHHPRTQYSAEHVSVDLVALHRGSRGDGSDEKGDGSTSVTFNRGDLVGDTLEVILEGNGVLLETPELMKEYEADLKKYHEISPRVGAQYLAEGFSKEIILDDDGHERWGEIVPMTRDGRPSKAVIDDREDFGEDTAHVACDFWEDGAHKDDDEREAKDCAIPIHPVVRVFSLFRQNFNIVHVSNLTEYIYDAEVGKKIVLPEDSKKLIDALVVGTVKKLDDIVKGKALGIIVLCTGSPGTGKTLTAEVYSEVAKRPLYTVQCSQLGTSPVELEKSLFTVLERANRWGAILLLDEADVYIHERGEDVEQNAIVGVFLRLLEYYNGILFMNTNRQEVVDDAIISRVTAHVKYTNPGPDQSRQIWRILLEQYKINAPDDLVALCSREWAGASGRNIRQIIRLGKMMADHNKHAPRIEDFRFAATFQDLAHEGKYDEKA